MDEYEEGRVVQWFKLGLYPNDSSVLARKYPVQNLQMSDVECERYVMNYLGALGEYIDKYLTKTLGDDMLDDAEREYILTVPAVWPPESRERTLSCVERAGMGTPDKIQVVTEPEAAGLYALRTGNIELHNGDTFVICDAGGG